MSDRATLDLECRFDAGEAGRFSGYASRWNEPDAFGDIIKRGAFARSLEEHRARGTMPALLMHHNGAAPVGAWEAITEDADGLRVVGRLITATRDGADAYELMKAGALSGLSIGFQARAYAPGPGGTRTVTDINLIEISLTAIPAAPRARITQVRHAGAPDGDSVAAYVAAVRAATRSLRTH